MEVYLPYLAESQSGLSASDWIALASGFGGAVIGSIVGGAISWALTVRSAKIQHQHDVRDKCLSLMLKASIIQAEVLAIEAGINESLERANSRGLTDQLLWRRVQPLVGSYQAQTFDPHEIGALIEVGGKLLAETAIDLFMRYPNFLIAVETYNQHREQFKEVAPAHSVYGDDSVGRAEISREEANRLRPYEIELESLIVGIREHLPELKTGSALVTFEIGPLVNKFFKTRNFPELGPKEAVEAARAAAKTSVGARTYAHVSRRRPNYPIEALGREWRCVDSLVGPRRYAPDGPQLAPACLVGIC